MAGLRLRDLTLLVRGAASAELPLRGRTLDEAFAFLESHFGATLRRPDVDLPDHPVAHGAAFDAGDAELSELARYYANAAETFDGTVRCWPHHFDIATLIELGDSRTIGIGMSPGDATFSEPLRDPPGHTRTPRASARWRSGAGTWRGGQERCCSRRR